MEEKQTNEEKIEIKITKKAAITIIISVIAIILLILLIPKRHEIKDAGIVEYNATLYSIVKYHTKINNEDDKECYIEGYSLEIFGFNVHNKQVVKKYINNNGKLEEVKEEQKENVQEVEEKSENQEQIDNENETTTEVQQ